MSSCNLKLCGSYRQSYTPHQHVLAQSLYVFWSPVYSSQFLEGSIKQYYAFLDRAHPDPPTCIYMHAIINHGKRLNAECACRHTPAHQAEKYPHLPTIYTTHNLLAIDYFLKIMLQLTMLGCPRAAPYVRTRIRISRHFLLP